MATLADIIIIIFWTILLLAVLVIAASLVLGLLGIGLCDIEQDEDDHLPWV